MLKKYCQSQGPQLTAADIADSNPLKEIGLELGDRVTKAYNALHFHQACEEILTLIRASNKFIDESAPWSLFKQGQQAEVEQILYTVLESVRLAAYLLSPIVPNLSSAIYQQLGFDINFNDSIQVSKIAPFSQHTQWGKLTTNQILSQPQPVFVRLEMLAE
jgi:methionyl-tRNA synthetase